jgi:hypothetical protein
MGVWEVTINWELVDTWDNAAFFLLRTDFPISGTRYESVIIHVIRSNRSVT